MTASAVSTMPCPRCGTELPVGQLVCTNCGALVFARQLNEIAAAAQQQEPINPAAAISMWNDALMLLPRDSQQHQMVLDRIRALGGQPAPPPPIARPAPRNDPLGIAIAKTVGSMIVSFIVYAIMFSGQFGTSFAVQFAAGFVLLILIHELGHSMAMRYYGLKASPPIFIPFVGALINLRQQPRNALEEAVVGIGGPVMGTIGAMVTYLIYLRTGSVLFLMLAQFGFFLNLINMAPVPPLDGGRVTAAVSPWVWIPGIIALSGWVAYQFIIYRRLNFIFVLMLLMAWQRLKQTLTRGTRNDPYYQIGVSRRVGMGAAYAVLCITLAVMLYFCKIETQRFGPGWI